MENKKSEKVEHLGKLTLNKSLTFSEFENISDIESEWRKLTYDLSIFFSFDFLKALECCPPSGLENRYLICYKDNEPYGIMYCQLKAFNGAESIKFKKKSGFSSKVTTSVKNKFASILNFEGIVCGSVLLTGSYAYHYFDNELSHKDTFLLAEEWVEAYRQELNKQGHKIKVTFLKDFYTDKKMRSNEISESKFQEFSVQPNMILHVRAHWLSYDDYLKDFQSKYRVRAKRARKKFDGIKVKELDYVDIKRYNTRIYSLYRNIVDKINFNLFFLHEDYFAELKKRMKNKFRLFGYFKGEEMVAFYTCIDNGTEMNAHFLGYDPALNTTHQLYLNSLYDMIELSLECDFETINFSRTAMEIKSSVGAEPHDMLCYLKHENNIINQVVSRIVDTLNPTEAWVQRSPFKKSKNHRIV